MRISLVVLVLIGFSLTAQAAPYKRWVIFTGATFNQETSPAAGSSEFRSGKIFDNGSKAWSKMLLPATLKMAWFHTPETMVVGQYSTFQSDSGGELIRVERRRDEYRLGYKYIFNFETGLHAALGGHLGWVNERISTNVTTSSADQGGRGEPLLSASASAFGTVFDTVMLEAELMYTTSETLTVPAPMMTVSFNVGWRFNI